MTPGGIVYLVGAGPGDPGLFTLRGAELLARADAVVYDGLVNLELLRYARSDAEIIYGGKHDCSRRVSQEDINALLVAKAREGKKVVRLKGGDPYLFGRGGEEAEVLVEAGIPFETVPGVSSVTAVPAYAGIPLTHRDFASTVTIVTGHDDPFFPACKLDWACIAQSPGTLVILMGLRHIKAIAEALVKYGRAAGTPVAVISRGTTGRQSALAGTLATIGVMLETTDVPPPAVTVVGEVVGLRDKLNWFEGRL